MYDVAFLHGSNESGQNSFPLYMDTLLRKRMFDELQKDDKTYIKEEDEDYSGFKVNEGWDGPKNMPKQYNLYRRRGKIE